MRLEIHPDRTRFNPFLASPFSDFGTLLGLHAAPTLGVLWGRLSILQRCRSSSVPCNTLTSPNPSLPQISYELVHFPIYPLSAEHSFSSFHSFEDARTFTDVETSLDFYGNPPLST